MNVSILGTGNMGAGFAALLAEKHDVCIGHPDRARATELASRIGQRVRGESIAAAVASSGIIILAVPFAAVAQVLSDAGDLTGKIIVDITNPVSADFSELSIGYSTSAAEEIQKLAPLAKVVKAFNTLFAQLLPEASRQQSKLQTFIASDDSESKARVTELAESVYLQPVDAGPLKNSRYLEPLGALNIQFGYFLGQGPVVAPAWIQAR